MMATFEDILAEINDEFNSTELKLSPVPAIIYEVLSPTEKQLVHIGYKEGLRVMLELVYKLLTDAMKEKDADA